MATSLGVVDLPVVVVLAAQDEDPDRSGSGLSPRQAARARDEDEEKGSEGRGTRSGGSSGGASWLRGMIPQPGGFFQAGKGEPKRGAVYPEVRVPALCPSRLDDFFFQTYFFFFFFFFFFF